MSQSAPGRRRRVIPVLAVGGALVLTGCADDVAVRDSGGGGGAIGDPGGAQQLSAPEPEGSQLSHEEMREALESEFSGASITDTDDVLPGLRDLETELQRLRVNPQECKQYVVESASPLPDGALMAHAIQQDDGESGDSDGDTDGDSDGDTDGDSDSDTDGDSDSDGADGAREVTVYSFTDWRSADAYLAGEEDGLQLCESYTVTRDVGGDESPSTEVALELLSVGTAADAGLGLTQEMTVGDESTHLVAVALRQGSQIVLVAEAPNEEPEDDDVEDLVEDLQEQAAAVLSELTGDDLSLEEDEEDTDGDGEGEEDSDGEGEEDSDGEDSDEGADDAADADADEDSAD
ncbi:hypothetical protein Q7C18_01205 [Nesterenkonia sp. CL21]|uniref:hypothetical protein n=1 Tax=Nesterenkonia sp. CL21 TaxID=3064894 RepID=UPI0028791EEF|nr:hypothetical protein [Nesterenkonia sp. CL21]MDS2171313.1 hypothetical protein [Nesterenkonia sp. CL21]